MLVLRLGSVLLLSKLVGFFRLGLLFQVNRLGFFRRAFRALLVFFLGTLHPRQPRQHSILGLFSQMTCIEVFFRPFLRRRLFVRSLRLLLCGSYRRGGLRLVATYVQRRKRVLNLLPILRKGWLLGRRSLQSNSILRWFGLLSLCRLFCSPLLSAVSCCGLFR